MPGETLDAIGGTVRIIQRADGYRFNLDAVLLAAFALDGLDQDRPLRVIDLGTGSGVVALLLAHGCPRWNVSGVEVQPSLAALARRNATLNGLPVSVIEADWRSLGTPGRAGDADLVVCNPPYYAIDRGQPCDDEEKAAARQELHGGVGETIRAASRLVKGNGHVRFIHAAPRLPELIAACEAVSLRVVRLRFVHSKADEPAYGVLLEAMPSSRRPLTVSPPLVVHRPDGAFSEELQPLLKGVRA